MNGQIYRITNILNGKKYIGQTKVGLKKRYRPKWWRSSNNPYLKHSVIKYGIDSFKFEILESGIKNQEALNDMEGYYANFFNSYIPNGYNIRLCGGQQHDLQNESTKLKISNTKSKKVFLIKASTKKVVEIDNLTEFCKKEKLNKSALLNLTSKISDFSQDFIRATSNQEDIKRAWVYEFLNPCGELVVGTTYKVCKDHKLKTWVLDRLVRSKAKQSKGWSLIGRA